MNSNKQIKDFYAFSTTYVIGIFTDIDKALACIGDRDYTLRVFSDYFSALRFLKIILNKDEQLAFGIFTKNMAFDKPYYRQRKKNPFENISFGNKA